MGDSKATMAQMEILVDFMERNGDVSEFQKGNVKDELENLQKWVELTDKLNDKYNGDPKTLDEWKKFWEYLKTNAQNQLRRNVGKRLRQPKFPIIPKRIMAMLAKKEDEVNRKRKLSESSGQEDNAEEVVDKEENINNKDESNDPIEDKKEQSPDEEQKNEGNTSAAIRTFVPTRSNFVWALQTTLSPYNQTEINFGASTSSVSLHESAKRRRVDFDRLVDMAERYLDFEKKKALMEHGRELLIIKQNEINFGIIGKLTQVLESAMNAMSRVTDSLFNLI